jgi:hypothetical protein
MITEREESAGNTTNRESKLPNGKAMTDRELMDKAWDYLASYTVGERPNASEVNDFIAVIEDRMNQPEQELMIDCPRCGHCCPQPNQKPVAWWNGEESVVFAHDEIYTPNWTDYWTKPLYAAPQPCPTCQSLARAVMMDQTSHDTRRQWVGLTYEEIKFLRNWWPSYEDAPALLELVKDVEAKLREKNEIRNP